jgi:hypothetical protein
MQQKPYKILVDVRVEIGAWANNKMDIIQRLKPEDVIKHAEKTHSLQFRKIRLGKEPFKKADIMDVDYEINKPRICREKCNSLLCNSDLSDMWD